MRPDTYVGSIEAHTTDMFVVNPDTLKMEQRKVTYVPGLYKIFDEIVVNAADNKQRDATMTCLKIEIDQEKGRLSVMNDGKGIPCVMHKEHNVYVPELIFGHLLAGSNFNDEKKKTTGGRNGYGAKLANIFSTEFIVETADRCVCASAAVAAAGRAKAPGARGVHSRRRSSDESARPLTPRPLMPRPLTSRPPRAAEHAH